MNDLSHHERVVAHSTQLLDALRIHRLFLVTYPDDAEIMEVPGGGLVYAKSLVERLTYNLLTWAEIQISLTKRPIVDVVDYWATSDTFPHGWVLPVRAEVFRYNEPELGVARVELTVGELADTRNIVRKIAKISLLDRLSQGARQVG